MREHVVGYIRSAIAGTEKLKEQQSEVIQYCNEKNLDLVKIFEDNGASGATFDRDGWKAMEDYLINNHGTISFLIVSDLSRISRNEHQGLSKIKCLSQGLGIDIKIVREKKNALFKGINIGKRKPKM